MGWRGGCGQGWGQPHSMGGPRGGPVPTVAAGTWAAESCSFRICMASSWGSSFFPKSLLRRQHRRVTRTPESRKLRHHPNPSISHTLMSPRSQHHPNPIVTQILAPPKPQYHPNPQDHLHPIITQISTSPKPQNHPDPKVTQIPASPKSQDHPYPIVTQISMSPKPRNQSDPKVT